MATSEEKYWKAYRLFNKIGANFYTIENENPKNLDELINLRPYS